MDMDSNSKGHQHFQQRGNTHSPQPSYGIASNEWRILMIGKTGVGKSATGNSILGYPKFKSKMSGKSVTRESQIGRAERFGKKLVLVDTPGIFDTGKTNEEVMKEIVKCIGITSPGLHAIILVVHIGRFTEEEKKTVDLFLNHLGQSLVRYLIVVFTRRDDLDREGTKVDEYVCTLEPASLLGDIIQRCEQRFVAFDNTAKGQRNDEQVRVLFGMIDSLISKNGGGYYTNEMYQEAEKAFRVRMDEERRRLKEEEARKIEEILAPYKADLEREKAERESLSLSLKETERRTQLLDEDRCRIEREMKSTQERMDRESKERDRERQRIEEDRQRDRDMYQRNISSMQEEQRRRDEQRQREFQDRQRLCEEDLRRREKQQEEAIQRASEEHKREIARLRDEYSKKTSASALRDQARTDVEKEKPGILQKLWSGVKNFIKGIFRF